VWTGQAGHPPEPDGDSAASDFFSRLAFAPIARARPHRKRKRQVTLVWRLVTLAAHNSECGAVCMANTPQ